MVSFDLKNRRMYIIAGLVAFFSLFALWVRLIPMFSIGHSDILLSVGSDDPLYNLRQVEQLLANFPNYAWFDPVNLMPGGVSVYWGPLFIFIGAVGCMLTGAVTRPEIIQTCLVIPPIMAAVTVILMYPVGKICGDWKTGLLASGFTATVSGQFFYRSFYGYFDHHIGEVLFSTLFCLCYMYALVAARGTAIDLKDFRTYKKVLLLSVLAGIAYLLDLFLMPTVILFALIVVVFTLVQVIVNSYRQKPSEYLVVINSICFAIATVGIVLFGFKNSNGAVELSTYSIGHVYAYFLIIIGTVLLYMLARFLKNREKYIFPATIIGIAILFVGILYVAFPQLFNLFVTDLYAFFGQSSVSNTVEEARGWALDQAWTTFNYGLILMAGGVLVMLYNNIREEHPHQVFALIWSLIILFSTWQHIRYEYYLAVNVALLSAVCVSFTLEKGLPELRGRAFRAAPAAEDRSPGKKQKKAHRKGPEAPVNDVVWIGVLVVIAGLGVLFAFTSASFDYSNAVNSPIRMNGDWKESLEWMGNNTPDTGVNYLTIYDPKTFHYPPQAYGVMSWWDYGHMITYIAKRIPNANPFQQGVDGPNGSAAYFMAPSEDTANAVLDNDGTRYVITDIEMDTGKFWAMATWYNATAAAIPYQTTMYAPSQGNPESLEPVLLDTPAYYQTMISRLHNFDGSMAVPGKVYYVEYADPQVYHTGLPVITNAVSTNETDARARADAYNAGAASGTHAIVVSPSVILPVGTVPALLHYRLVHESPTNVFDTAAADLKYVKIFEYVKGARIKGDGIIDLELVTNTGRNFTYRQQSVNGEFIVPYSTTGNPYDVRATGKYQIEGTNRQIDVPESAVMQGLSVP
ncbi:MAG TPA: oligosaccharyl transferase, archaeosortase A system-associated [Methanoregula sp.]|nr:oligosaccharyl transferase, archaeosortase A system-associated [Methanoregula sp.]